MHRFFRTAAVVAGLALLVTPAALADEHGDYSDPDYAAYDVDNMARTSERQGYHATSESYAEGARETFGDTFLQGASRQFRDLDEGRVYAGAGQLLPGGNVGDPEAYHEGPRVEVEFLNREGTKLVGNVWPCREYLDRTNGGRPSAGCPLVVVTTGSIQVTQHMYGWLARHLQDHGYTVFTFDVRGQGESETTNQQDLFASNPQDGANFVNGTVDALRFALSTPDRPYHSDEEASQSSVLARHNPASAAVDPRHIALVGHSLGASAVTTVQQCTSRPATGEALPTEALPDGCLGQHFPIDAIVAYDSLGTADHPLVPAFSHEGDGYFVNAVPTPQAPDADSSVDADSNYGRWVASGNDAMKIIGRGFTHAEWSQIPYIVSATRYGVPQAKYYTLAWLDRYVDPDPQVNRDAQRRLLDGPVPTELPGAHLDHRASLFSGKYRSAAHVSGIRGVAPLVEDDLRAYAGVAAVGDWAALNAEQEYGTATRGALHEAAAPERSG